MDDKLLQRARTLISFLYRKMKYPAVVQDKSDQLAEVFVDGVEKSMLELSRNTQKSHSNHRTEKYVEGFSFWSH